MTTFYFDEGKMIGFEVNKKQMEQWSSFCMLNSVMKGKSKPDKEMYLEFKEKFIRLKT